MLDVFSEDVANGMLREEAGFQVCTGHHGTMSTFVMSPSSEMVRRYW